MASITRVVARALIPRAVRNWVRSPSSSIGWLWSEFRHVLGVHPVVEVHPGWRIRCHPAARRSITRTLLRDPEQVAELNEFIRACTPSMVLFDLGAHFGVFSLAAAHRGGPGARIVAVEPSEAACRILRIQAQLNAAGVQVVRAAAGDRPGSTAMLPVGVIANGYFVAADAEHSERETVRVPTVSIDSLADELGIDPTHVKIDVEGAEEAVLRGGEKTLGGVLAPLLFVELHNDLVRKRGGDPQVTLEVLARYGYDHLAEAGQAVSTSDLLSKPLVRVVARKGPEPRSTV